MLARELSSRDDIEIEILSFSRQYPAYLFPGKSDKDPTLNGYTEPGTQYVLDSMNPLTWRKTVRTLLESKISAVIIPWWTAFWTPCFGYIARALRKKGVRVVFMCHNTIEHETAAWKIHSTHWVLNAGNGFIVHTNADRKALLKTIPDAIVEMHPHPVYEQFPDPKGKLPREHALELLFFGFVRPYKGLDILLDALGQVDPSIDWRLCIAGEFWSGEEDTRTRIEELGLTDRVELVAEYLTDEQVAEYFGRAHAVVLPYRSATGSGVTAVAYNYSRPVLVTRTGGLPDVVEEGITGWVVSPESPESLARAIERMSRTDLDAMQRAVKSYAAQHLTWEGLADTVLSITTD